MIQATSDTGFSAPLFVQEMASYLLDKPYRQRSSRPSTRATVRRPTAVRERRSGTVPWSGTSKSAVAAARVSIIT